MAGRSGREHRPVLDVVGAGPRVPAGLHVHPVLVLRQEPEVVVALDRVAGVAGADPDLCVQHLAGRVPQLGDPLQAERRLLLEHVVRVRVVARRQQHERVGVAGGVGELLVAAARVEPAAGHVDRPAGLLQRAEQVVVAVVARVGVDVGLLVGQVGGLPAEHGGNDIRPVALRSEVPNGVVHQLPVQLGAVPDDESGGGRARRRQELDLVLPRQRQSGEAEPVHRLVVGVPGAHVVGGRAPVGDAVRA